MTRDRYAKACLRIVYACAVMVLLMDQFVWVRG